MDWIQVCMGEREQRAVFTIIHNNMIIACISGSWRSHIALCMQNHRIMKNTFIIRMYVKGFELARRAFFICLFCILSRITIVIMSGPASHLYLLWVLITNTIFARFSLFFIVHILFFFCLSTIITVLSFHCLNTFERN